MGEGSFLPLIAMFAVIVVFMILPQMKRAKQERKFANELKRGERVIMKNGMHGKIAELNDKDNSCIIETPAGKLKFERTAISMEMSKKLNAPVVKK